MVEEQVQEDLATVFAHLDGLLLSDQTVARALALITELATEALGPAIGAGISLMDPVTGLRATTAGTDQQVLDADDLQYQADAGPCLDAWRTQRVVRVDDTRTDTRYPQWSPVMAEQGLLSSITVPIGAAGVAIGAIKVYGGRSNAFDAHHEHLLHLLADQAAILLAAHESYERAEKLSEDLREALRSRDVIGQAKGILMAQQHVAEDAAFQLLVRASQRSHTKLRVLAEQVVASVLAPRSGDGQPSVGRPRLPSPSTDSAD